VAVAHPEGQVPFTAWAQCACYFYASADAGADLPRRITSRILHDNARRATPYCRDAREASLAAALAASAAVHFPFGFGLFAFGIPALAFGSCTGPRNRQGGNCQPDGCAAHHKTPVLPGFPGCLTTLPST